MIGGKKLTGLFLLLLSMVACSPAQENTQPKSDKDRPNVIIISLDTTRAGFLGSYGHPWVRTPNLDRLASRGVTFLNCISPAPETLPSHTSLFTGTYPHTHGTPRNAYTVHQDNVMLGEILRAEGYHNAGFISALPLNSRFNFPQGFDHWDDELPRLRGGAGGRTDRISAEKLNERIFDYLDKQDVAAPLFLFAHYFDPHAPYSPPDEFLGWYSTVKSRRVDKKARSIKGRADFLTGGAGASAVPRLVQRYAAEISYMDHHIGRLLDGLKRRGYLENAIVLATSDHGETLWERAPYFSHGWTVYNEAIRVVGMIQLPEDLHAGTKITTPISTVDWMPTVLNLLGLEIPDAVEGVVIDFSGPSINVEPRPQFSQASRPRKKELSEGQQWPNMLKARMVREEGYKLIQVPHQNIERLYNLRADPRERKDLLSDAGPEDLARAASLRAKLTAWAESADPKPSTLAGDDLDDTLERLKDLGYLE